MAVPGVAHHIEDLVNQQLRQRQEKQSGTTATATDIAGNKGVAQDSFTPSAQTDSAQATAQAAGIFQLNQGAVTPDIAPAQTTPNANQNALAVQAATAATTNAGATQTATGVNPDTPAIAPQLADSALAVQAATPVSTATPSVQDQIQSLNTALAALGLNNSDIQQIDRIATVIQNFNPSAYSDLINQFESLARDTAPQPPTNTTANVSATTGPSATASASSGGSATATSGGFQVQGVSINFTGAQGTGNSPAGNGAGQAGAPSYAQGNGGNLQSLHALFTLINGNGETVQLRAT